MAAKKKAKKTSAAKPKTAANTFAKRSKAAKKGWATRRKNVVKKAVKQSAKRLKNAQLGLPKKQRVAVTLELADKSKAELLRENAELKRQLRTAQLTEDWVYAMPDEYLSADDNHITLEPSRARHLGELTVFAREKMAEAWEEGTEAFDAVCYRLTDWFAELGYEMSVREIYTLWFSP